MFLTLWLTYIYTAENNRGEFPHCPCSGSSQTGYFQSKPLITSRAFHFIPASSMFSQFQTQFLAHRSVLHHWGRDCPHPTEVEMSIICVAQSWGSPWASDQDGVTVPTPSCPPGTSDNRICSVMAEKLTRVDPASVSTASLKLQCPGPQAPLPSLHPHISFFLLHRGSYNL